MGNHYQFDGLASVHNHDFLSEPSFVDAYQRGIRAVGKDYQWYWRVHVGLWCASLGAKLDGDFVECGTNRGFLASAIMQKLRWNDLQRMFWLMDTFSGLDSRYVSPDELQAGALVKNAQHLADGFYATEVDSVRANFSQWHNVNIVAGSIPDTLPSVSAEKIAFLHIDMNCAPPEVEALRYFWPRLSRGAAVLLDDYAYRGFEIQKVAMDTLGIEIGFEVLSMPTGQGLIIKH